MARSLSDGFVVNQEVRYVVDSLVGWVVFRQQFSWLQFAVFRKLEAKAI